MSPFGRSAAHHSHCDAFRPLCSVGLATLVTVNRWLVAALEEEDAADAEVGNALRAGPS